jgi:hypothetical protein
MYLTITKQPITEVWPFHTSQARKWHSSDFFFMVFGFVRCNFKIVHRTPGSSLYHISVILEPLGFFLGVKFLLVYCSICTSVRHLK